MAVDVQPEEWRDDEQLRIVVRWRYDQAKRVGLNRLEARLFAEGDGDLHQLVDMIEHGCDPTLAAHICI